MRGKVLVCILAAVFLLAGGAMASEVAVEVNGTALAEPGIVEGGVTYVPLVPLLEALGGGNASWDAGTRTARADTGIFELTVPVGEPWVLADGYRFGMDQAAVLRGGRTYVPLRPAANLLGAQVVWNGWNAPVEVSASPPVDCNEEDFYWLTRIISAESQGESLYGQLAVGSVVLRRMADPGFPDTIREVIFDTAGAVQFEPTANGTVYKDPTEQSVLAAKMVLAGTRTAGDSLFFFAPALSEGTWIRENRQYVTTIGCHMFFC